MKIGGLPTGIAGAIFLECSEWMQSSFREHHVLVQLLGLIEVVEELWIARSKEIQQYHHILESFNNRKTV